MKQAIKQVVAMQALKPIPFFSTSDTASFRALEQAVKAGDYTLLHRLLSQEERSHRPTKELVNIQDKLMGMTPLLTAASVGDVDIIQMLLQYGADHHAQDRAGFTPLHYAAKAGSVEAIDVLLQAGSNVMCMTQDHDTCMHIVARTGKVYVLELLVQATLHAGGQIDARNKVLNTPLHLAAAAGQSMTVGVLLEHGASLSATNAVNNTALHEACGVPVLRRLIQAGADLNATNEDGCTALHIACSRNLVPAVTTLLDAGANRDARNHAGQLPIDCGGPHGSAEVVRLLRQEVAPPSPSPHRETRGKGAGWTRPYLSTPEADGCAALPVCAGLNSEPQGLNSGPQELNSGPQGVESDHVETVIALCKILSSTSLVEMGGNVHGGDAVETILLHHVASGGNLGDNFGGNALTV